MIVICNVDHQVEMIELALCKSSSNCQFCRFSSLVDWSVLAFFSSPPVSPQLIPIPTELPVSARPEVEIGELAFCHFAHPTLSHGLPDNVIMSCHCHKDNIIFLMKSPEGEVDPIGGDLVSPSCPPTSPDLPSASLMCQLLVVFFAQIF